jgi:hypothetical protein
VTDEKALVDIAKARRPAIRPKFQRH